MKDAFDELSIAPIDSYIDFGRSGNAKESRILKGDIAFTLNRPVKMRSIMLKFKGITTISIAPNTAVIGPTLHHESMVSFGKQKISLKGKSVFSQGSHTIPWQVVIPNNLPQTLALKRATIAYQLEAVVLFGIKKSLRVSCPITIRKNMLPSFEKIPVADTRLFQATIPRFHYEIEAPTAAYIELEEFTYTIKLLLFALDKPVRVIKSTLVQVETFRSQPQSHYQLGDTQAYCIQPEWSPIDQAYDHIAHVNDSKTIKANLTGLIREYTKPAPSVTHAFDENKPSSCTHPLVLRQPVPSQLTPSIDSPLLTISHQLHITITFINKIDEITIKIPIAVLSIANTSTTAAATINSTTLPCTTKILEAKDLRIRPPSEYSDVGTNEKYIEEDSVSEDSDNSSSDEDERHSVPLVYNNLPSEHAPSTTVRPPSSVVVATPTTMISAHTFGRPVRRFASALDVSVVSPEPLEDEGSSKPQRPLLTIDVSLANGTAAGKTATRPQMMSKITSLRKSTSAEQLRSFRSSETLPESDRHLFEKFLKTELENAYQSLKKGATPVLPKEKEHSQSNNQLTDTRSSTKQHSRSVSHPVSSTASDFQPDDDDKETVSSVSNVSETAPSLSSSASMSSGTTKSHPLQSRPPTPVLSLVPALPGSTILHHQIQSYSLPEEEFQVPSTATTLHSTVASSGLISPFDSRLASQIIFDSSSSDMYDSGATSSSGISKSGTRASSASIGRDEMMRRYMRLSTHQSQRRQNRAVSIKTSRMTRLYDEDGQDEVLDPLPPVTRQAQYSSKTRSTVTEYSHDYESNSDSELDQAFSFLDHDPHARSETPLPRLPRLSFGSSFAAALGVMDDEENGLN
ncbi:hypothetical protein INT43_003289 [Umbelopsis isabellina]|uniref:Arrestin C-terminal-like domain-containing protein n=1 Tax=Mortierella isabellina TaxID=91625 RepID=A0A8H7PRR9_MORIS|nr:hypothetical protein INT43_003289 [Umbelopsis isabellina]